MPREIRMVFPAPTKPMIQIALVLPDTAQSCQYWDANNHSPVSAPRSSDARMCWSEGSEMSSVIQSTIALRLSSFFCATKYPPSDQLRTNNDKQQKQKNTPAMTCSIRLAVALTSL